VTLGIETPPWDSHERSDDLYKHSKQCNAEGARREKTRGRTRQDKARKPLGAKSTIDLDLGLPNK